MLHSMTIRLIYVCISLRLSTYVMGVKCQSGVTEVKRSFSL